MEKKMEVSFVYRQDPDTSVIVRLRTDIRSAVNIMAFLPACENVDSFTLSKVE